MLDNTTRKIIHIDSLVIITIVVTLQSLLCESIITMRWFLNYLEKPFWFTFIAFAILEMIRNKVNLRSLMYLAIPLLLSFHTSRILINKTFVFTFALMVFCSNDSIEKVVNIIYHVTRIFFWSHLALFFLSRLLPIGLNDYVLYDELGARYGIFTYNPNTIARVFIFYVALSCFVHDMDLSVKKWLIIFATTTILFYLTRSDALYLVGVSFLLTKATGSRGVDRILTFIVKYGVPIFTAFSLSIAWTSRMPFLQQWLLQLNVLMSNRLTSNLKAIGLYGLTWFGKNSVFGKLFIYQGVTYNYIYADNMYVYMMVHWGLVYLLLFAFLLFCSADKLNYKAKAMILILLMYGIGENGVIGLYSFFSVLIAFSGIVKNDSEKLGVYLGGIQ
ncbi:hypothetical protein [Butyrivibrio sp. AE2032]|uniref:hypothetical protein n=1 Tax=Butyrivibrio sp. AE2032 TaxID=1458463 RepID=UPI000552A9C3|nr:hypothetical protein [Butyrivibrio sp. AE2032]